MKRIFILLLICAPFFTVAQRNTAETFGQNISVQELKKHLYVLASDAYEGRETGMEGQRKAAQYLDEFYAQIGIPTQRQIFPLKRLSYLTSTVQISTSADAPLETFNFIQDLYFFSAEKTQRIEVKDVVFVGYGISDEKWDDYKGLDVKGKVVFCLSGEPVKKGKSLITGTEAYSEWSVDMEMKRRTALEKGAILFVQIDQKFDQYMGRVKYYLQTPRMTLDRTGGVEDEEEVRIPYLNCSSRMAEKICQAFGLPSYSVLQKKANAKKRVKAKSPKGMMAVNFHVKREDLVSDNVLAFLEGTDPELKAEIVVVSAHYDHVGIIDGEIHNGADDDGSGTVSVMEIARAFKTAKDKGMGSKRSVLFLHVSGEEKGLLGSEWYSDHPVYPLANTVCDLNVDMVGRKDADHEDGRYVYLIGSDKLSTDLHKISEEANKKYTQLNLDYTYNDPNDPNQFYYRSDHYNFAKHNIPVIFYFSGVHEDYHKPGDDPEKIMYEKMAEIGKLVFHTAWEVANRPERLKVDVANDFEER
ncbi:MAG: hypothetical protein RL521_1593 [Bacteroidota bacterium]